MRRAVIQNEMGFYITAASQGGAWAIIQAGFCVVIPAESANIVSLLKHVRTEVNALNDPQPRGLNTSVVRIMVISGTHSNDQ